MIVVIRENGCVEWTKQFKNILILNKSDPLSDEYNHIDVQNVGREFHTIFTYIYNNYENLDNYIIFITVDEISFGKICSEMINRINYYLNNNSNPFFEYITHYKYYIHTSTILSEREDEEDTVANVKNAYDRVYRELFSKIEHKYVYKPEGSSFIVSNKLILARSKNFYLKIIQFLEHSKTPIEHYVIDVIIQKIFMDRFIHFNVTYRYNGEDSEIEDIIPDTPTIEENTNTNNITENIIEDILVDTNPECPNCMGIVESIPNCVKYFCSEECYNKIHNN
jgi:hypothetical protein